MSDRPRSRRTPGSTALTPLLDMLFLLLFALLATSRSAESMDQAPREEIAIELPSVTGAGDEDPDAREPIEVTVAADGAVVLAGVDAPSPAALTERLEALVRLRGEVSLELRVDGATPHAVVADVLQATRAAGVHDVRFIAIDGGASDGGARFGAGGAR